MDLRRIEEISLNSWPTLQQILYDGWILRFSKGYTKRANSVTPLYDGRLNIKEKIRYCEETYGKMGLSTIFRVIPITCPDDLDKQLQKRGYRSVYPTDVQYLDLETYSPKCSDNHGILIENQDNWISFYQKLSDLPSAENMVHSELIGTIPSKKCLMLLQESNEFVSCGLGVIEGDYLGLFDFLTANKHRNRGFGKKIVSAMLNWGKQHGAKHSYLQLVSDNAPARSLYTKFGFKNIYEYWYRVRN